MVLKPPPHGREFCSSQVPTPEVKLPAKTLAFIPQKCTMRPNAAHQLARSRFSHLKDSTNISHNALHYHKSALFAHELAFFQSSMAVNSSTSTYISAYDSRNSQLLKASKFLFFRSLCGVKETLQRCLCGGGSAETPHSHWTDSLQIFRVYSLLHYGHSDKILQFCVQNCPL